MNKRLNFQKPKIFSPPQNGKVINYNGKHYFIGKRIDNGNGFNAEVREINKLFAKIVIFTLSSASLRETKIMLEI